MRINARADKSLTHIRIITRNKGGANRTLSVDDARKYVERGVVDESNAIFRRLVDFDFDVKAVLDHYRKVRDEERKKKSD